VIKIIEVLTIRSNTILSDTRYYDIGGNDDGDEYGNDVDDFEM